MIEAACAVAVVIWACILLMPDFRWRIREKMETEANRACESNHSLKNITVLIPARNEGDCIQGTLNALTNQDGDFHVVVIDDQSTDHTAEIVQNAPLKNLTLIHGSPPPVGWSGKLWALQQGLAKVNTPYVLLLDADIQLHTGFLQCIAKKLQDEKLDFISLMAHLRMQSIWEKLLLPAFVYYFKMIYPFARSNNVKVKQVAAAAGGIIFTRTKVLNSVDAFSSLRDAVIDDCTLASVVKQAGYRTWIGLTKSARSTRSNPSLKSISETSSPTL